VLPDDSAVIVLAAHGLSHMAAWAIPLDGSPPRVLVQDPENDVTGTYLDPYTGAVVGVYIGGVQNTIRWLDPTAQRRYDALQRVFGKSQVEVYGWTADGTKTLARVHGPSMAPIFWNPEEILTPTDGGAARWLTDERGYSCYLLSFMIASAVPQERLALERMLTAVGQGTPLSAATSSELHQTLREFTDRYREFARALRLSPRFHQVREEFPEEIPTMPEPAPVSAGEVRALMEKLCAKLQNCRD
jgi:hypothetical protein